MAIAKKVATKKAPAKKAAVVKKTPVRRNTRRKSALPENIPDVADLDLGSNSDTAAATDGDSQGVSLEGQLAEIEVIDLRKLVPAARVAVFQTLEGLGYLERSTLQPVLVSPDSTFNGLFKADAISLNHANKLLTLAAWDDVKNSYAISRTDIQVTVGIDFSTPGPVDPDYMSFGDSHYVRVPKEVRDAAISALGIIRKDA